MACERFRDALADVVAGAPARAGVEAHLASCDACRAEVASLRQALAVADAELGDLLSAEPTPALAVRIRRAVAEAEAPAAWRFGWLWPATATAGVLLVVVVLAVVWRDGHAPAAAERADAVPTTTEPRSTPAPVETVRPAEPSSAPTSGARVRSTEPVAPPRVARATPPEPEVLVPPGETDALLRLVALVHRDRRAPASLAAAGQPSADLAELAPIDLKPLEIVPLDPAETSGT
jgi:hypothetical protein